MTDRNVRLLAIVSVVALIAGGCVDFEPLIQRNPDVPEDTIAAAGESDDPELVQPLLDLLTLRNDQGEAGLAEDRAVEVVISLGKRHAYAAIPNLARALVRDESEIVRYHSAEALGRIGREKGVESLYRCLINEEEELLVREKADEALSQLVPHGIAVRGFDNRLAHWKAWWEQRQKGR